MTSSPNYLRAIDLWSEALGPANVVTERERLDEFERATFETKTHIPAAIFPSNTQEVRTCLLIAADCAAPVFPVSSGKNWGYGSRVPAVDNCVLMDFARMARITAYDEALGFVSLQPGVTFIQLTAFLQARQSEFFCPMPGTTPEASVVGNLLERGIALGPHAERASHACNFEIVLPNGSVFRTGLGGTDRPLIASCWRWGLGPQLDGMFSQSNLGVVTEATVWLTKKPRAFQTFSFTLNDRDLPAVTDAIRDLRMAGVLRTNVTIGNAIRMLSARAQSPIATDNRPRRELLDELIESHGIAPWNGEGALYSSSWLHSVAERRLVTNALAKITTSLEFCTSAGARWIETFRILSSPRAQRVAARHRSSRFLGAPVSRSLRTLYWRKPMTIPSNIDPDRDRCGLIWYSAVIPHSGELVLETTRRIHDTLSQSMFDPNIGISTVTERVVYLTAAILYDLDSQEQDAAAKSCYQILVRDGVAAGIFPARLVQGDLEAVPVSGDDREAYLTAIRSVTDPTSILSPGRYSRRLYERR